MMKYSTLSLLLTSFFFCGAGQAFTLIPGATNSHTLTNQEKTVTNTFLTDETIQLGFTLTINPEHVGKPGRLYVVAKHNDQLFMFTQAGWLTWDFNPGSLQSFLSKTLEKQEQINLLNKTQLPAGEFLIYTGYQVDHQEPIFYSVDPASLLVFDKSDSALHHIKYKEVLSEFFDRGPLSSNKFAYPTLPTFSPAASLTGAPSVVGDSGSSNTSEISQTNIQELGVDESDRVKAIKDQLFTLETCAKDDSSECLNAYRMIENPAKTQSLGKLELGSQGYQNGVLYLPLSDSGANPTQLIYLNDSMNYPIYSIWRMPYYWRNNETKIKFIDVSQPSAMQIKQTITINSALISSRIVNNVLYLVTRKNPEYQYPEPIIPMAVDIKTNPQMSAVSPDVVILPEPTPLPTKTIDNLLPTIAFDKGEAVPLVKATDCYVPALSSNKVVDNTLITVTAIPLQAPQNYYSVCIAGNVDTFYMSTQAIYLASSRYPYQLSGNNIVYNQPEEMRTEIHKFTLANNALQYKGSGSVPGHLGWEVDKQPFRMGEYNNILKVATSRGDTWSDKSTTRVSVLQEDLQQKQLKEISSLDNLGKPGERLYAARFIQNRGYLVTFRVTDPLYVLDFTEPTQPNIIGELQVNGYSDYLHPIGDQYLLGIGKDAIPDTLNVVSGGDSRGAWYQGVKLSLYDVSGKVKPSEVQSLVIGKRGTDSAVLSDHHALAWLASGNKATLAIPIELHNDFYPSSYGNDYSKPNAYYEWTHTGLYTFSIDTSLSTPMTLQRRLIANTNDFSSTNYSGQSTYNDRAVIQGGAVHYLHDNRILSTSLK